MLAIIAVLVAALAWMGDARAQEVPTERTSRHSTGLWIGAYSKYRVSDRVFYYGEYHFRRRTWFIRDMAQVYLRFGATWRPRDDLELTAGVVTPFYWSAPDRDDDMATVVPQFRFWEQAALAQAYDRVRLYHQFRFEQRWARSFDRGSPFRYSWRWRYKIAAYIPVNRPRMVEGAWFVSVYDEIFLQTGRPIIFNPFEDNRLFVGVGYVVNEFVQVQVGYMWTVRHDGAPNRYEHRHIPRISVYHTLDLREIFR